MQRLATPWREMLLNLYARGSQLFQEATELLQWWRDTRRPGLLSTEMSVSEEHVAEIMSRLTSWVESQGSSGAPEFWFDLRELASSLQQIGPAALLVEWQEDFLNGHRGPVPDDPGAEDMNADVPPEPAEGQCIVCLGPPWPRSSRASILMCGHVQHLGCWLRLYHNRVDNIGCRGCQLGYRRFCGRLQNPNRVTLTARLGAIDRAVRFPNLVDNRLILFSIMDAVYSRAVDMPTHFAVSEAFALADRHLVQGWCQRAVGSIGWRAFHEDAGGRRQAWQIGRAHV